MGGSSPPPHLELCPAALPDAAALSLRLLRSQLPPDTYAETLQQAEAELDHAIERVVPRSGSAVDEGLRQPPGRGDGLVLAQTLGAQPTAVHGMIRITLHGHRSAVARSLERCTTSGLVASAASAAFGNVMLLPMMTGSACPATPPRR